MDETQHIFKIQIYIIHSRGSVNHHLITPHDNYNLKISNLQKYSQYRKEQKCVVVIALLLELEVIWNIFLLITTKSLKFSYYLICIKSE